MRRTQPVNFFFLQTIIGLLVTGACYGRSGPAERFPFKYQNWSAIEISPNERFSAAFIGKDRILVENWISLFDSKGNVLDSESCGRGGPADIVWSDSGKFLLAVNEERVACLFEIVEERLQIVAAMDYPEGISIDAGAFYQGSFYLFGDKESAGLFESVQRIFYRLSFTGQDEPQLREWVSINSGGRVKMVFHDNVNSPENRFFIWQLNCVEEWDFDAASRSQRICNDSGSSEFPVEDVITAWKADVWGIDMDDSVFVWDWEKGVPEYRFKFEDPFIQFSAHHSGLYFLLRSEESGPGSIVHYSRKGEVIRTIDTPWNNVFCMDLSRNKAAVLSNTGEVFVTDL